MHLAPRFRFGEAGDRFAATVERMRVARRPRGCGSRLRGRVARTLHEILRGPVGDALHPERKAQCFGRDRSGT